jgi:hypothetical protein
MTGFPLRLSLSIFSDWPATKDTSSQLKKLIVPTDFTVNWGHPTISAQISVTNTAASGNLPGKFQINGFDTVADGTTLSYGNAGYTCSRVLSIVQNQHKTLNQGGEALYELVLAFQIANKSDNPTSPDIILLTRPIVFSPNYQSFPFLSTVDLAAVRKTPQATGLDLSTLFGYNSAILMPMVSYQTCLPVKLTNTNSSPYETMIGSIRMRVNVVMQPLYVNPSANGLGLCSSINKYTLVTEPKKLVDIFLYNYKNQVFGGGVNTNVYIQFKDGYGTDGFPAPLQAASKSNYLVPLAQSSNISAFSDVIQKIQVLVPEEFIGKSLAEISNSKNLPASSSKKKKFKCYTIDPNKDIVNGQIMIDPTTGKSLKDTLDQGAKDASGGDAPIQTTYYTLYGDSINGTLIVKTVIPLAQNSWNLTDLNAFVAQDGSRVRIAFASLNNTHTVNQSLSYIGDYSSLTSNNFSFNNQSSKFVVSNGVRYIDMRDDLNDDTATININVVSVNNIADSSGILPGDIEEAFSLTVIIIFSIILASYLSFIVYKIIFRIEGDSFPYIHILIFFIALTLLSLFGVYVEKPLQESKS